MFTHRCKGPKLQFIILMQGMQFGGNTSRIYKRLVKEEIDRVISRGTSKKSTYMVSTMTVRETSLIS